jgi:hypothetical protein
MKNTQVKLVILIASLTFDLHGQEAKITAHVTDVDGLAISNAQASAGFMIALKPGEGWGTAGDNEARGITDPDGICSLTGQTTAGSVGLSVWKDGYYDNGGQSVILTNFNSITRLWEPWNQMVEVVLEKIDVQVPMYARRVWDQKIPVEGKSVGFDLMIGDWVTPYGKGQTSDFLFLTEIAPTQWVTNWYGTSPRPYPLRNNQMTIKFSNNGDGIESAAPLPHGFRVARQAPSNDYEPILEKVQNDEIIGTEHQNTKIRHNTNMDKGQNYFFRVRTKKDAQGNITSALYGKIYGEFNNGSGIGDKISFTYYLNPEPNSRNVEFDPKRNLFKSLPSLEQVSAP